MPLKSGRTRAAISHNIKEMIASWKQHGRIDNSHPRTKKKALKQAIAISLKKAGKSKYQSEV